MKQVVFNRRHQLPGNFHLILASIPSSSNLIERIEPNLQPVNENGHKTTTKNVTTETVTQHFQQKDQKKKRKLVISIQNKQKIQRKIPRSTPNT